MKQHHKFLLAVYLILFSTKCLFAQKLPGRQELTQWASTNIIVDGNAVEWAGYQAYNSNTEFFYSIANDQANLYLIIHAAKSRIMEKIIEGGISFTINRLGKKDDGKRAVVLFPVMPLPIGKTTLIYAGKPLSGVTYTAGGEDITAQLKGVAQDKSANTLYKANETLLANLKEIKISGIPNITDTVSGITEESSYYRTLPLHKHLFEVISINNKDNIRAVIQFDSKGELTYELQLPLNYVSNLFDNSGKFIYNIKINGRGEDARPGNTWTYRRDAGMVDQDLETATDFWSEYTLAKKP